MNAMIMTDFKTRVNKVVECIEHGTTPPDGTTDLVVTAALYRVVSQLLKDFNKLTHKHEVHRG